MDAHVKKAIDESMEEIRKVQQRFDEMVKDLPEQTREVRERTSATLGTIREKLEEAMKEAQSDASEAQLKAHLGLMEAQDRLEASRKVVDEHLAQFQDRSKTMMDEMQLKTHLATMEAQDFWERRGQHLAEEFRHSQKSMQSLAGMAVNELQEQFGRWNAIFQGAVDRAGDKGAGSAAAGDDGKSDKH